MSSAWIPSSSIDSNTNSSSTDGTHTMSDVLLYAESKLTRKQAVREIGDLVLRANMKPRTVKHALQLLKAILPSENTLPATVNELFGAMLSSENDWRLAQYLIRHKQQPSFTSSSPNLWSENSDSNTSITAASSSSIPLRPELDTLAQPTSLFLPVSNSNSSSSSSSSSSGDSDSDTDSESSSSTSSTSNGDDDDEDDDDDDDESHLLLALHEAQPQRLTNPSPLRPITESADADNHVSHPPIIVNSSNANLEVSEQRSQMVTNSINRYPFLGSFKRQRSETSSTSEPDLFYTRQISDEDSDDDEDDDDDDDENLLYSINNNSKPNSNSSKSCCFEMNGCDLLDGGKRRRH